jgi:DAACS family dicarboxylate/amino acid:cation (Na+ or H+) symporter
VLAIVPDNPLRAAVNGDMLAVMFFSLMIGLGLALAPRETVAPLVAVLEGLYAVVMQVIELAMRLAPYGVAALLFTLTACLGAGVLRQLASYVFVVLAGLAFHQFVACALIVRFLGGMSPRLFFTRSSCRPCLMRRQTVEIESPISPASSVCDRLQSAHGSPISC